MIYIIEALGHKVKCYTDSIVPVNETILEEDLNEHIQSGYSSGEFETTAMNGQSVTMSWEIPNWQDIACELANSITTGKGKLSALKRFNENWI